MVVVVADPIFEPGRRAGRLDTADESIADQHPERVVDRLQRDGADLGAHQFGHAVGGDVRLRGHGAQDGQALRRHLNPAVAEEFGRVGRHAR